MAGPHGRPTERRKVVKASPALHMKVREQKAAGAGVRVCVSARVKSEFWRRSRGNMNSFDTL